MIVFSPGDGLINEIPDLGMERDELKAAVSQENTVDLITNAVYLQDQALTLCGIKLYGTPWWVMQLTWGKLIVMGRLNEWGKFISLRHGFLQDKTM